MKYSLSEVFEKISEKIDIVYLVDTKEDTYTTLKDNELFHGVFGDSGKYSKMQNTLYKCSIDKKVIESEYYNLFYKDVNKYTGNLSNDARFRIQGKEVTISISVFSVEDTLSAILISEIGVEEYKHSIHKDQRINAIKSAYLFSMNVDLVADTCGSLSMSEVEKPANEPDISYSDWRKKISNMFPPEEQETFNNISDPDYLKSNLQYNSSRSVDCRMMNLEGNFIWVKLIFNRIDTGNDEDFRFIFMVEDVNESHMRLMEDLNRYEELSNQDSLTGLMNHCKIESVIKMSIEKSQSEHKPSSIIMFDVDYFKQINDTYGHATGDDVLKNLSDIVSEYLNLHDGKIGRWGGEEFIGVIENATISQSVEYAEELRSMIAEYEFSKVGSITCSFGVTEIGSTDSFESVFERVDKALYLAKNNGRNRVVQMICG